MENEAKLFEEGVEKSSAGIIIIDNLMMILWMGLGFIGCLFISPILAGIYLAWAVTMIYVILRKLVCTKCYYYDKLCHSGWGKLSALFFKKDNVENFNCTVVKILPPLTYGLLLVIPLVSIIISMNQSYSMTKIIVLILLLSVSSYSGAIGRKKSCERCKMKYICPGSAAK